MTLKYHISPSALTEDFLIRIWEAESDTPLAYVHEETVVAPHASPATITVNGLDKVVHIVRMYGVTSATLLHEYNVEPTTDLVTVFDPIQFKIGDGGPDTPAADTDVCTTPELVGLETTDFLIIRSGYGPLIPDTHFTFNSGTGEWQLTSPDVFSGDGGGEEFTILRTPQAVETVVNDSVVGKWFSDFVDISANTDYAVAHLRKLIRLNGTPTYTFVDDPPIGYIFCFQHFGVTDGPATIAFSNGTLLWGASPKSSIEIERYSEAAFVWDGTNWNTVYIAPAVDESVATPVAGDILGVGTLTVGNVASGDPDYTVTHNLAISGDYGVLLSIESQTIANFTKNNRIGSTWFHHATDKPNKFYISLQELASETQDLNVFWTIIKR
jgi:hypothetical protein